MRGLPRSRPSVRICAKVLVLTPLLFAVAFIFVVSAYAVTLAPQGASPSGYTWPLMIDGAITQDYTGSGQYDHTGTDIAAPAGTEVLATLGGYVKYVQYWDGYTKTGMQSYGNLVIIYHPENGTATYYAHLSRIDVGLGQNVTQGQLIGAVGMTGNVMGYNPNHLHIELRLGANAGLGTYGRGDGSTTNPRAHMDPAYKFEYDPDPDSAHNPRACVDAIVGNDGVVYVKGWAYDPDDLYAAVPIHVYVGGIAGDPDAVCEIGHVANTERPDVNAAFGIPGNHGFEFTFSTPVRGINRRVELYALNVGRGTTNPDFGGWDTNIYEPRGNAYTGLAETRYYLRCSLDEDKVVDISGISYDDWANVGTCNQNGGANQRFWLVPNEIGAYEILAEHSGKALEVPVADWRSEANVAQFTRNWSRCQLWYAQKNSDGTFSFRNSCSGLYLDRNMVSGNIQQYWENGGGPQKWRVVPVEVSRWNIGFRSGTVPYTGKAAPNTPVVSANGSSLYETHDYVVTYSNNVKRGVATVTVTGANGFEGSKSATYEVGGNPTTMHRLYNPNSGEHFYTSNNGEKDELVRVGWRYEGVGWKAPAWSTRPVYRLYNPNAGDHHYTMNKGERDNLLRVGWRDEGVGWYSTDKSGTPLYRQYNPNAWSGSHNYTKSKHENDSLVRIGWRAEGIAWYGLK